MMIAYTVLYNTDTPHPNVGPTFPTEEDANEFIENEDVYEVATAKPVVSHIEEFNGQYANFVIRTDMNHELSYVVTDSENLKELGTDRGDTAFTGTIMGEYDD